MTTLEPKDFENFWIRVYLNPKGNLREACANRAYRDLNRTLRGLGQEQAPEKYKSNRGLLIDLAQDLISLDVGNQNSFDELHQERCEWLINQFNVQYKIIQMTIGQAQKWINMYLKYLFALGDAKIPEISKNYQYFHVPIDNIIQELLKEVFSIERIKGPWSAIANYPIYLEYQKRIRENFNNQIPMDIEFRLFNRISTI